MVADEGRAKSCIVWMWGRGGSGVLMKENGRSAECGFFDAQERNEHKINGLATTGCQTRAFHTLIYTEGAEGKMT